MLQKDAKIYVAGHRGLVGSAISANLRRRGYTNIVERTHDQLDLTDQQAVQRFFADERPQAVVLAAAHVGGIMANSLYRADFIMQNMMMQCNIISQSYATGVEKLLFLGSTCIYPKQAPQPMTEDSLLTSPLEYTNEPYAVAKIAGLKMCEAYNLQYGTNYIAVMPTNLYGPNDNFHLENSHVLPAMIRKIHLAKMLHEHNWGAIRADLDCRPVASTTGQAPEKDITALLSRFGIYPNRVDLWGTGRPLREFLWSEDMADACVHLLLNVDFAAIIGNKDYSVAKDHSQPYQQGQHYGGAIPALGEIRNCHINIGTGEEITIAGVADLVAKAVDFTGEIHFDASKPDGTMRKLTDVTKLHSLGWKHSMQLNHGIEELYRWYIKNQ